MVPPLPATRTGNGNRTGRRSGGRLLVDALRAHGARRLSCVPGESFLGLLDALYDVRETLAVITCRHEHGAAMMAEAWGKLTGAPGICVVTRAPGAGNAAIGVHTAFQDSTPLLLIVGQVRRAFRGREAFQEVDLAAMFRPLAKHVAEVAAAAAIPAAVAEAYRQAMTGRRGPAVLIVPEDVFREAADVADVAPLAVAAMAPEAAAMTEFARHLAASERPLLIVGGSGWSDQARADILAFAEAQSVPVCCSFRRLDLVDNRRAMFVGELSVSPDPRLLARIAAADLVIAVGSRLGEATSQGYRLFAATKAALIHIHPATTELNRVFPAELAIAADVAAFAKAARALPVARQPDIDRARRAWAAAARADYRADRESAPITGSLDLHQAMRVLDARLPDDAIVTVDAGNFSAWPQRFVSFGGARRFLGPANGAMGYAVPAAVAAQLADPARTVVACVGDGGFAMTGLELATAVRHGARPLVLVFDNAIYGTIRMHQERSYPGRPIATDLGGLDVAACAAACGAWSAHTATVAQFAAALDQALTVGRAAVIVLAVAPEQISSRACLNTGNAG